jgi:hypothetical protein
MVKLPWIKILYCLYLRLSTFLKFILPNEVIKKKMLVLGGFFPPSYIMSPSFSVHFLVNLSL